MRFILSLLSLGSIIWVAIDSNRLISTGRVTKKDLGGLGPVGWPIVVFFISIIGLILYMVLRSRALAASSQRGEGAEPGYIYQPPLGPNGQPIYQKPPKSAAEVILIILGSLSMLILLFGTLILFFLSHVHG